MHLKEDICSLRIDLKNVNYNNLGTGQFKCLLTENWKVLEASSKVGFFPWSDTFVFCLLPITITW